MANKAARERVRTPVITSARIEPDDDAPETQYPPAKADPAEQSYTAFIAGFTEAKGCRVKVHRQTPRGLQYCFTGTPEEIDSEETIRLFHAKQPYAHEDGLYFLSVEVSGELRNRFPVNIAPQVGAPEQHGLQASGGMAEMLRLIQQQNERLERLLTDRTREQPPMLEMVEGLQRLDQLRGGAQQPQLPIDTLMKAIELGQKMNNAGVPVDSWEGMLRDVIKESAPVLVPALMSMLKRQPQPEQISAPPGQPGTPERKEPAMTPEQQDEAMLQEMLKQAIAFLKKKAERNSDPGLYVDMIMDNREEPLYARLVSDILEKDFSSFAAIDRDIEKPEYFGFFRFIYDGIRSVFDQARAMAATGAGKAGNKGNAPGDGGSGKKSGK